MKIRLVAFLGLGLLMAPGLVAQTSLASAWQARLHGVDRHLRAGKYRAAERESRRLASQMIENLGTGQSAAYTLAVTCVFRAIAEQGLGNEADASWYWWTARNVFSDITKADLSPYGEPARVLQKEKFRDRDGKPKLVDWSTKGVKPPVITKKKPPSYPHTLLHMGVHGVYIAQVIVEPDGSISGPQMFQPAHVPAMVYVVLEAIHHWHFQPATLNGRPVPYLYMLTVNFRIKGDPTDHEKHPAAEGKG